MSDLCHNCGDCHLGVLPVPCKQPMNLCQICGCYGHTYNFCPQSVRLVEPNYLYWMICHNCDGWHLPNPCPRPYSQCGRCGQFGHIDYFCALNPKPRTSGGSYSGAEPAKTSKGQKKEQCKLSHAPQGTQFPVTKLEHIHTGLLANIRADAVMNAMKMLDTGLSTQHVVNQFRAAASQPMAVVAPLFRPAQNVAIAPASGSYAATSDHQQQMNQHTRTDSIEVARLADSGASVAAPLPAIAPTIETPADTIPAETPAQPVTVEKPASKPSTKRKASNSTRCAGCVKKHKKCTHNESSSSGRNSREQSLGGTPGPTSSEGRVIAQPDAHPDDVFGGGNIQVASFTINQQYGNNLNSNEPIQPHEQAEIAQILSHEQAMTATPNDNDDVFSFDENGHANWAGGAVQETIEVAQAETIEPSQMSKAAPKKRGGNRKKA